MAFGKETPLGQVCKNHSRMTLNSSSGFHRSYFVLNVQLSNHNINGLFCVNSSLLSAPAVMALFKDQSWYLAFK
ncbi:hypothetical protein HUJ04_007812 [Dendroctonus ponderosae]|nr:hypothetical protein HUJ04_007812 [Dendroctonus ponderosae]